MASQSARNTAGGHDESLVDDLIREILNEPGRLAGNGPGGPSPASLEAAFVSMLADAKAAPLERVLIAEAFGSALAEALAPALAEQLRPTLMKHLDQIMSGEASGKDQFGARSSSGSGRKSNAKGSQ